MAVCVCVPVQVGVDIIVLLRIMRDLYIWMHIEEQTCFVHICCWFFDMFIALAFVRSTYQHFWRRRPSYEPSMPLPYNYLPIFVAIACYFNDTKLNLILSNPFSVRGVMSTLTLIRPAHRHMHLCVCVSLSTFVHMNLSFFAVVGSILYSIWKMQMASGRMRRWR